MVDSVNGVNNGKNPEGYNKVTLYNEKTKKTKSYFIPIGKNLVINNNSYDIGNTKNGEFVIKGTNKKDSNFSLIGLSLEHMDVNTDSKIDTEDSDFNMAGKLNKELDKSKSDLYVKSNDAYSDAGIYKGEGGVVFSNDVGDPKLSVRIEDKEE